MTASLTDLTRALAEGTIVFLGGAGVSTDSGIPDFRSAAGLYATRPGGRAVEYLLSRDCLVHEPEEFFAFYRSHLLYPDAQPNLAHRVLADLEAVGRLTSVVTQNIDGLHQAAGSRAVRELHGSVHRNSCTSCRAVYDITFMLRSARTPTCPVCGARVRPDVVLYGEPLDVSVIDAARREVAAADVLLVGGTSLTVYPAAGLVSEYMGDRLIIVNESETPYDDQAALLVRGNLGRVLADVFTGSSLKPR